MREQQEARPRGGMTPFVALVRSRLAVGPSGKVGIHNLSDLRLRCRVDEITGCWHWRSGTDGCGRPTLRLPALGKCVSLGTAIAVLVTGKAPERGIVWHCICSTDNCGNPEHRRPGTRASQMQAAKIQRSPLTRSRIALAKRAVSKLSDEACEDIRTSCEPLRVVAERYGISLDHASGIRRGLSRNPIPAVGASVFSWRPAPTSSTGDRQ